MAGQKPDFKSSPEGIVGWSGTTKDGRRYIRCEYALEKKEFTLFEQDSKKE